MTGFPILVAHCMSTPVIPSESCFRTTSSRFGSHWNKIELAGQRGAEIMDYAKLKLLCTSHPQQGIQNGPGCLACLCTRFALEFNMDGTDQRVTHTQVERHMRLCVAGTAGLEKMITVAGSEPLLAEAAYELMDGTQISAVCHLAKHSDLNCVDRGRRGELVAVLLIMQTYDAARKNIDRRWVSVANFMEALLPPAKYNTLLQSVPSSWPENDRDREKTFEATFQDYGMWFNHVIKIENKEMISVDHLWKFVTRGAMILCATNQEGIDIVLPVCHTTQSLGPDSVTAIIIQVKNDKSFKNTIRDLLFDNMNDVVKTTIFSKLSETWVADPEPKSTLAQPSKKRKVEVVEPAVPKPVIRMVFALASPEPAVVFKNPPEERDYFDEITTFDIWLAGLSDETYRQIEDGDLVHYQTLLERSLAPHDAFELKDVPHIGEVAKKSRGSRRRKLVPLTSPEHAHHSIHRVSGLAEAGEGSGGRAGVAGSQRIASTAGPSTPKKKRGRR